MSPSPNGTFGTLKDLCDARFSGMIDLLTNLQMLQLQASKKKRRLHFPCQFPLDSEMIFLALQFKFNQMHSNSNQVLVCEQINLEKKNTKTIIFWRCGLILEMDC